MIGGGKHHSHVCRELSELPARLLGPVANCMCPNVLRLFYTTCSRLKA
jgi:hypothetical protein